MSGKKIGILVTGLITALIHLVLLSVLMGQVSTLFVLNGLGFLGLLAAYLLPLDFLRRYHGLVRWTLIAFTAVTILAWVAIGNKSLPAGALGYLTKIDELILIVLLWLDKE